MPPGKNNLDVRCLGAIHAARFPTQSLTRSRGLPDIETAISTPTQNFLRPSQHTAPQHSCVAALTAGTLVHHKSYSTSML